MNAYEGVKRMYSISEELSELADKLGNTKRPTDRENLERKINNLEVEFFQLKHQMEKTSIPGTK